MTTKSISLTNDKMTPNRFGQWAGARRRVAWIIANLEAGKEVWIGTQTRQTKYTRKHIDMFKATRSGAYVQSGKSWLCIDFCRIIAQ